MSDFANPYLPPQAEHVVYPGVPDVLGDDAAVPDGIVEQLRGTRPWVTFLSVIGFLGAGLTGLGGFAAMVSPTFVKEGAGMAIGFGLIYLALGASYLWPSLGLLRYGSAIGDLIRDPRMEKLGVALDRQRSFWKLVGIMTAVMIALVPVSFVVAVAYFAAKAMSGH
jgi:hypothetical protein